MAKFPTHKIAIIGAGAVGATSAYAAAIRNIAAQILLIDVNEKKEEGEVMDIRDGLCFTETGGIIGANYPDAADADVIVITAGLPQKPGETRLDLIAKNKKILEEIFAGIGKLRDDAIVVIVANPVDVLTYLAQKISGLPEHQVFGTGTTLDSARVRSAVASALGVSPHAVHGFVLGEHGDSEFVAWSTVTVGGIPASEIKALTPTLKKKIEDKVRNEAYEIISRKGATFYGIALVVSDIIESILFDQKKILPITTHLVRCNGVSGVCLGSPAIIGRRGVLGHWPVKLHADETKRFQNSAKIIGKTIKSIQ